MQDPGVLPGFIGLYAIHDRRSPSGMGARWLLEVLQRMAGFEQGDPAAAGAA